MNDPERRELFALVIMHALINRTPLGTDGVPIGVDSVSHAAVKCADALLKELAKDSTE